MALGDFQTALEMKSLIETLVNNAMEANRPRYQYATVTSIDRTARKCGIQFPGEAGSVTVNMGSVQPARTGQTVRVGGLMGDRFIEDVMGDVYQPPFNASFDANMWGISNLGTTVLGKLGDTAQKILYWRKRTVDNTSDFEGLQYLTAGTSSSTLDTVLRQDGTELGRYSLYTDGSFRTTKGIRANTGDITAASGNMSASGSISAGGAISGASASFTGSVDGTNTKYYGQVNDTSLITPATGWSLVDANARRWGNLAQINFAFSRTGTAIASNASGNITNVSMGTVVNATYQPYAESAVAPTRSTGILWGGYINSTGNIVIAALPPNVGIATGDSIYGSCVFIV